MPCGDAPEMRNASLNGVARLIVIVEPLAVAVAPVTMPASADAICVRSVVHTGGSAVLQVGLS